MQMLKIKRRLVPRIFRCMYIAKFVICMFVTWFALRFLAKIIYREICLSGLKNICVIPVSDAEFKTDLFLFVF